MADAQSLVLGGADERDLARLAEYRAIGGYAALEKARGMTREQVIGCAGRITRTGGPRAAFRGQMSKTARSLARTREQLVRRRGSVMLTNRLVSGTAGWLALTRGPLTRTRGRMTCAPGRIARTAGRLIAPKKCPRWTNEPDTSPPRRTHTAAALLIA